MTQSDLANIIAALILTHGAAIGGALWATFKFTINRVIDWTNLQRDIMALNQRVEDLEKDRELAYARIRNIERTKVSSES